MNAIQAGTIRRIITGLRSGKYQQTTGRFSSPAGEFCILGLARKVAGISHGSVRLSVVTGLRFGDQVTLVSMNDCDGVTFPEFADILEDFLIYHRRPVV